LLTRSAEPRVFTLAGKSADEVGALGSEMSQEVTGIEERLALAALGPTQPVAACGCT